MTHWKAGWTRLNPHSDSLETLPLVLCLPGVRDFPGDAVDDVKLVDCPNCVKILKQCKVL